MNYFDELATLLDQIEISEVETLRRLIHDSVVSERLIFVCGNGGSAAIAQHFATDLSKDIEIRGQHPRVIALNANSSLLTAFGNDYGYENTYSQQIHLLARSGDLLVTISGSGSSENILNALRVAREIGMRTFALNGFSGGLVAMECRVDGSVNLKSEHMGLIEDTHQAICHQVAFKLKEQKN